MGLGPCRDDAGARNVARGQQTKAGLCNTDYPSRRMWPGALSYTISPEYLGPYATAVTTHSTTLGSLKKRSKAQSPMSIFAHSAILKTLKAADQFSIGEGERFSSNDIK